MSFAAVPGAKLYWKRDGRDDAPRLVLLNSIGTDMDLWDAVLPHLRERFALLRLDTRGHGASIAEPGDGSLAQLADDVIAVADAAGFDQFSLAGVSLGGMIGMQLALVRPERVEKLALICTSATMDAGAWSDRVVTVRSKGMGAIADLAMGRFLSEAFALASPAVFESVRRQLLAMDAEGYAACGTAIRDMDLIEHIAAITCRTLVVTGSRDTSTPYAGHGERLVEAIPGAVHLELDAAHLAPIEAPEALSGALLTFFQG